LTIHSSMIDRARLTRVLSDLVSIESVNPELVPGGAGEREIARYVVDFLKRAGLEAEVMEVAPGRFNALGALRGRGGGPRLMLNGHLDTVGVARMEGPFSARVEGGRLYGRGAQDMKGGVAAALLAVEALARDGPPLAGDVLVAAVADEEYQSAGTRALLGSGVAADAAIVMEPTGLEVVTAHKGFAWAEVETQGRAAHGSRPEEGLDAIAFMGRVLSEIERLQAKLGSGPAHPLLGHGSVHASLITGGQEWSSYPADCRLSLERRLLPGEDAATLDGELHQALARLSTQDPQFSARYRLGYSALALETKPDSLIARTVYDCARRAVGAGVRFGGQSFWTDAALLSEAGMASVLFGPGGAGLHSTVEYVSLDDVALCAETLVACAQAFCGEARVGCGSHG
jgi:acetylornithine deacetylase